MMAGSFPVVFIFNLNKVLDFVYFFTQFLLWHLHLQLDTQKFVAQYEHLRLSMICLHKISI